MTLPTRIFWLGLNVYALIVGVTLQGHQSFWYTRYFGWLAISMIAAMGW